MRGAIAWFAENHVAANLLMLFIIIAGVVIGLSMKLEIFPDSSLDRINISVVYPGASPSEVEEAIIRRIEERVSGLAGIKRIDSTAREGVGSVYIEVMSGWDLQTLLDEVKSEVDRIRTFPEEAEDPVVREVVRRNQVINVAVYGDVPEETLKHLAERMKDDITNLPEITLADLFGVREGEITIEVSEETLRRYGLTLSQVARAVSAASLDLPAGSVKTAGGEILIRTKGRRYRARDYMDVAVITRSDGTRVTLGQIARVRDGFEDSDLSARFNGKPAAAIQVYRVADQNALTVAAAVREYMEKIRPTLPAGVDIAHYQDMSVMLKSRINLLLKNMAMGLALVGVLLALLLNLRLAFWVTLGIPISFLFGLMILPRVDVSINMISLFAFIMVLGIVVDDAIIIGENIFKKREEGLEPLNAAISGAIEVGLPVIFSVMTTIVAFWPLLMGSGMMGRIMRNIPYVVILVLLGSLIECLFVLPAHLAGSKYKQSLGQEAKEKVGLVARRFKQVIDGPYARLVDYCVRWRYVTVALGLAVLLIMVGTFTGGWLKFTFFPEVEGDFISCAVTMPMGTPVEETTAVVDGMDAAAREALGELDRKRRQGAPSLFEQSIALIGLQLGNRGLPSEYGGHLAQIWVQVLEGEKREHSAVALTRAWRERVGPVPEAEALTFQSDLFSAGNPVEIHLSMEDYERLMDASEELKDELREIPGVFDVADSFIPGKREVQLKLKPAARSLGLTLNDLAQQVRHAFYGAEALRLLRDQDEVKVMVRYPERERESLGYLENMRIRTPSGFEVPFRQVAEARMEQGYAAIQRAQRRRVIKVTADVDESMTNANEVRGLLEREFLPKLVGRHLGLRYSIEGEGKEQKESLGDIYEGFVIALFCIYALLAIPFKSFTQPFVVMAAIPFGLAGALMGHLLMGYNLTFISLFGMVGLAGVVVNDSLVLIHATNRLRSQGATARQAVVQAGCFRFRAIILTSITTFAGLTPILMEKSLQAQFMIPMAISLGFGVLFATFITLLLIPCGYMILEDIHGVINRILRRSPAVSTETA